jgi:thymidylate kinase
MTVRNGRLIAIEGITGPSLAAAARSVALSIREATGAGGVSTWDASGIFTELSAGGDEVNNASARTLTLLYAADLAFRVRWQIGPALEAGESVVAAPYIETAKALASAVGLPKRWLDELFAFAPKPSLCFRVHPRPEHGQRTPRQNYPEWFSAVLSANDAGFHAATLRSNSAAYLRTLQTRHRCRLLTPKEVDRLKRPQTHRT